MVASRLSKLFVDAGERSAARLLDVGAGTGLVGIQLAKKGFDNMEALGGGGFDVV